MGLEIDRNFFPGSKNEQDLVCTDDSVVDKGIPLTGLEMFDGFAG